MSIGALLGVLFLASCDTAPARSDWRDQVEPDGPCYRVDLSDGLSETDTSELFDLFDCLDQGGLTPLQDTVDALASFDRAGEPAALNVARLYNRLPESGLHLTDLMDLAIRVSDADGEHLFALAELAVEWIYSQDYGTLANGEPSASQGAIDDGVLVPLLSVVPALATTLQDGETDPLSLAARVLEAPETDRLIWTAAAAATCPEDPLAGGAQALPRLLGDALGRVEDTSNDHWVYASGNSLRDALLPLLQEDPATGDALLEEVLQPAVAILDDTTVVYYLAATLHDAIVNGDLDPIPAQLLVLANEDVQGQPLEPDRDSALLALIRILDAGNQEVECSVLGMDIQVADNFSVWLLQVLAEQDPETLRSGVEIAGVPLSWDTFLWVVEYLGDSCGLDGTQIASDAPALSRLVDPEVGNLMVVMLEFLQALHPADNVDRVPELVSLLSLLYDQGMVPPVEDLLRDVGTSALVYEVFDLLPVVLDPASDQSWCPASDPGCATEPWGGWCAGSLPDGVAPVDLDFLRDLAGRLVTEDDATGLTPVDTVLPLLQRAVDHPGTWTALNHGAALLQDSGSRTQGILLELPGLVEEDPDLSSLHTLAGVLARPSLTTPVLRIVETEPVCATLATSDDEHPGPLPFAARLVTGGTLSDLLSTLQLLVASLREVSQ